MDQTNASNPPTAWWLQHAAEEVLRNSPLYGIRTVVGLTNHEGFSGANLWQLEGGGQSWCLRAWPTGSEMSRLQTIHSLMQHARSVGLRFVPAVYFLGNTSLREHRGRLWDLTEWMPGKADFHQEPTRDRLSAVCRVLAQLHIAWSSNGPPQQTPCPAVVRRLESYRAWSEISANLDIFRAPRMSDPDLEQASRRAVRLLKKWGTHIPLLLAPWRQQSVSIQPCLCDIHHDHVLLEGNRVSGIIDYGEVKYDHPAVDLARLLGSLVGDDDEAWTFAFREYRAHRPLTDSEMLLCRALDRTGTILALATWMRRLFVEHRQYHRSSLLRRLKTLVDRVERWG